MSFEIYSSGVKIVTVQTRAYADTISAHGPGSYTYKVGAAAFGSCSDPVPVSFSAGATISRASRSARNVRVRGAHRHDRPVRITHRGKKRS